MRISPQEYDWKAASDLQVKLLADQGVPEAIEEWARRQASKV